MPISAAAADRTDMVGRSDALAPNDGEGITIAPLVQHATFVEGDEQARLVDRATALARDMLGDAAIEQAVTVDGQRHDRMACESIVILADKIHAAGALSLADALLDALLAADSTLKDLYRGRIIAK